MRLFANGKRVTQPSYGNGTIISTDERYTVIEFDDHGRRTFVTTMVSLEPTSTPAPVRAGGAGRARRPRKTAAGAAATKTAAGAAAKATAGAAAKTAAGVPAKNT
jgi:hypothetical protein